MKKDIEWLKKEFDDLFNGKSILTVGRSVVDEILNQLDEPEVNSQIDKLANFIMSEVEGEPSQNQGAVDTAIRIIKSYQNQETLSQEWIDDNKKDSGVHYIGYYVPIGRLHDLLIPENEDKSQEEIT